jgi:hypothetical protein
MKKYMLWIGVAAAVWFVFFRKDDQGLTLWGKGQGYVAG